MMHDATLVPITWTKKRIRTFAQAASIMSMTYSIVILRATVFSMFEVPFLKVQFRASAWIPVLVSQQGLFQENF